jgi:hypothetical protein
MKDKFKIIIIVLFLTLFAMSFIGGCSSSYKSLDYYRNQQAKYSKILARMDLADRTPQLSSLKTTNESISGGYYLTYMPLSFSEPDNIREARDSYLAGKLALVVQDFGLVPAEFSISSYSFWYSYSTSPNPDGTFDQTFRLRILKMKEGILATEEVWHGDVTIKKATTSDISLYFDQIIYKMFTGFPESQHTRKDYVERGEIKNAVFK